MDGHSNLLAYETAAPRDDDTLEVLRIGHLAGGEPRTSQLTGTKALMLAVFEDGIRCYLSSRRLIAAEAEDWLNSGKRYSPFAFVVLCETFGLDPQAARATIKPSRACPIELSSRPPVFSTGHLRRRDRVAIPGW